MRGTNEEFCLIRAVILINDAFLVAEMTFASLSAKDSLMKRRALRRHKSVRAAINRFWKV